MAKKPTIKGIFVNSHIRMLRQLKGEKGVKELERRFGKSIIFRNSEDVPVREEVEIIENILDIISDHPFNPIERSFLAGRLHFRNFSTTPFAKIIFSLPTSKFKVILLNAQHIAVHVFQGVEFSSEDIAPRTVKMTMCNTDYPIEHFRGFFQEWMNFTGLDGAVSTKKISQNCFEYIIHWKK